MKNGVEIDEDGSVWHYVNDKLHCDNGPAVITDSTKIWYQHGLCHRIDGPAMIIGTKFFWFHQGYKIDCQSQEEFEKLIKLKAFW